MCVRLRGAETSALCGDDPLRWEMRVLNLREVWYGGRRTDIQNVSPTDEKSG